MSVELINVWYIVAAALFVLGLKQLGSPATAVRGNLLSSIGMLIAVVVTLFSQQIMEFQWIVVAAAIGAIIGAVTAQKVVMTSMPEMVALFNGSGGVASLLVGWAALYKVGNTSFTDVTILLSILIGGVTFSGSVVAWGKLAEVMTSRAIVFGAQRLVNALVLVALVACGVLFCLEPAVDSPYLYAVIGLSLVFGVMAVIPIGGADMPVVISLLNSYSGLAACAAGFAINNNILIVAGSLVGAAGIILTNIMCKAMNRSLANVLFSGFGAVKTATKVEGEVKPITADDAFLILEAASSVTFVPGYGMAVAQAQHVVRELGELLEGNGAEVTYAIHPVAGRMPGHMNVLLAEANVPYDQLVEMDDINPRIDNIDVAVVIGANDVVNPAAREDENSPIYGMPIINVDSARTVFVLKRSMASGFSGVDNPLFFGENTRMLFGDAKESISGVIAEFKG
ncbi:MAG: NAD(P)(+) transhydrogenase (Re/Si-specific) subunit beta [Pseudomonadales bacterium]|jgi:NAD(P) transhydrogenase subunit beta|nr:NAD(P)(+) transhydrogenase (Re/Si-specific) subunit beta [Pseudomonadales bacterium]MDP6470172.1 NAD(P)(+) transhydrogenase (Re/Si-specific) subunit beta [Pseudomonadales bacterium]MDP6827078.1 NAD(P)(+) transhydrogenase (Re/Si-specific) subunit beta [Pseudomonadales bacterium]|tara:strand:+ start:771 stop:2132 length:1362 start_codon:yes stop_codon:yes gene_type:complete